MKPCRTDQIRNPATNRCVLKTSKLGQQILKAIQKSPQKNAKTCAQDEILNPTTNRCVKRTGKIGQKLVLEEKLKKQYYRMIGLQKGNDIVHVWIEGSVNDQKILTVVVNGNIKFYKYDTIQKQVNAFNDTIKKNIKAGFTVIVENGDSLENIQKIIDALAICKKTNNEVQVVNDCVNDSTLIMMDPLKDLPKNVIIKMSDGYCYDVNEIADSCISSKAFKNPLTLSSFNMEDITLLLNHPKLTKAMKAKVQELLKKIEEDKIAIVGLHKKNPAFIDFFNIFVLTSLTCVSDYTEDFKHAQQMLTRLSEELAKFKGRDSQILLSMRSSNGLTFENVMKTYGNSCIHGIGYKLCNIMFYQLNILLLNKIKYECPFITKINEVDYCFAYVHEENKSVYDINIYNEKLNTIRLGTVINDMLQKMNIFGIDHEKAKTYFETHIKPIIGKLIQIKLPLHDDSPLLKDLICFDLINLVDVNIKNVDFDKNIVIISGENKTKGTIFPLDTLKEYVRNWTNGTSGDVLFECTDPKPKNGYDWGKVTTNPVIKLPLCNGTFYVYLLEFMNLYRYEKNHILAVTNKITEFKKTISDKALRAYIHDEGDIIGSNHCQENTNINVYKIEDVTSKYINKNR